MSTIQAELTSLGGHAHVGTRGLALGSGGPAKQGGVERWAQVHQTDEKTTFSERSYGAGSVRDAAEGFRESGSGAQGVQARQRAVWIASGPRIQLAHLVLCPHALDTFGNLSLATCHDNCFSREETLAVRASSHTDAGAVNTDQVADPCG